MSVEITDDKIKRDKSDEVLESFLPLSLNKKFFALIISFLRA
jgi:hypothetical protein